MFLCRINETGSFFLSTSALGSNRSCVSAAPITHTHTPNRHYTEAAYRRPSRRIPHLPPAVTPPQSNVLPYIIPAILFTGMMTVKTLPSDKNFGLVDTVEESGIAIQTQVDTTKDTSSAVIPTIQRTSFHDCSISDGFNPLTPNDHYSGRTAPLTSKRCILYIYSTNIGTEYFKHGIYSPFFFSSKCSLFHNSNVFVSCIIHILYTRCTKIKKFPAPKG